MDLTTLLSVSSWPAAVVAVTLIVCVIALPSILTFLGNKRIKRVETSITENNGGKSIKDYLDRLETKLDEHLVWSEEQAARVDALEAAQKAAQNRRGLGRLFNK